MLSLYRLLSALVFYISLPLLIIIVVITGKHRLGLSERFARYPQARKGKKNIWLHAASVGEVQAVRSVFDLLESRCSGSSFYLTTMTIHGKRVAEELFGDRVTCYLAPLDIALIAGRAVRQLQPVHYMCFETELWPVLIDSLAKAGVRISMLNGRISERSYSKYLQIKYLVRPVIRNFERMAVISEDDRRRYVALGADPLKIAVVGNVKYDMELPGNAQIKLENYRRIIDPRDAKILLAGSTHSGEERMMLDAFLKLKKDAFMVVIAPRHTDRLDEIISMFNKEKVGYHLLGELRSGVRRSHNIVIVDTLGELSMLYGMADYVFCGGSLVERGGHNIMEAAIWEKVVFYGPSMNDFADAQESLESVGAGELVHTVSDLVEKIHYFMVEDKLYNNLCRRAGNVARMHQGSAEKQVEFIFS